MPAPSPLSISTSALNRLIKEQASYQKEYSTQQARITKLQNETSTDENAEYTLRQERKALEETAAMFPTLKQKIEEAKAKLETQLEQSKVDESSPEDVAKAKEAVEAASTAMREVS